MRTRENDHGVSVLVVCGLMFLLWTAAPPSHAQLPTSASMFDSSAVKHRVEGHIELGPMASLFLRGRGFPENSPTTTPGYTITGRLMWHPNNLFAVGIMTGYQLLVTEKSIVADETGIHRISAFLRSVPFLIDESLRADGLELGFGLGWYFIRSGLTDGDFSSGTRFELGSLVHGSYHWQLSNGLTIGPGVSMNYLPYEEILSVAMHLDVTYDLLSY